LTTQETRLGDIGERELTRHLRGRIPAAPDLPVGVGDDAAAVALESPVLVTGDVLVEGVHFVREAAPARLVGRKALTVNLSDVAAMGGISRHALVSLCLPSELELSWVDSLYDGLLERAAEVGVSIVGGNVARSPAAIVVDVTLLGEAPEPLLRSGAVPGDLVVVTGELGAAAEGVALLRQGARLDEDGELAATGMWTESSADAVCTCLRAQLDPRPPLALARSLAERGLARAGMDLSDGLSTDLAEMCRQSGLGARVEALAVPISPAVAGLERARGGDARAVALHGGEDYELLLAVAPGQFEELQELARVWGVAICAIGEFFEGSPEVRLRDDSGEHPMPPAGHDHFHADGSQGPAE
jgi:thiamine-monophosphate kinase